MLAAGGVCIYCLLSSCSDGKRDRLCTTDVYALVIARVLKLLMFLYAPTCNVEADECSWLSLH